MKYGVVDAVVAEYTKPREAGGKILGRKIADLITVNGVRVALEDGSWVLVRASSNKPETGRRRRKPGLRSAHARHVQSDRRGAAHAQAGRRI